MFINNSSYDNGEERSSFVEVMDDEEWCDKDIIKLLNKIVSNTNTVAMVLMLMMEEPLRRPQAVKSAITSTS